MIIRIDKIKSKPGPKCKKNALQIAARIKGLSEISKIIDNYLQGEEKIRGNIKIDGNVSNNLQKKEETVTNVRKVNVNIDPLRYSENNEKSNEIFSCFICPKSFTNKQKLSQHKKEIHFICRICEISCRNQLSCNEHEKLHSSSNQLFPFKCHLCVRVFNHKQLLKLHNKSVHSENFKVFGNVGTVNLNYGKEIIKENTNLHPIATTSRETKINSTLKPLKLFKNLSGSLSTSDTKQNPTPKSFNSLKNLPDENLLIRPSVNQETFKLTASSETEKNNPIPLKLLKNLSIIPSFKLCKLCSQYIKLSEMAQHIADHLSRAYPCFVCSKLFIDLNSLTTHIKTHETK